MSDEKLTNMLTSVRDGNISLEEACSSIHEHFYKDLGHTTIDNHRERRTGAPEVIYCAGKTAEQVTEIVTYMINRGSDVLGTRTSEETAKAVRDKFPEICYNPVSRTISYQHEKPTETESYIAVVTAGTSDLPVAEEASETARFYGNKVVNLYDSGVAGIHRLFNKIDLVRKAKVVIVVAGMEGALASVVGGMVDKPVIAVPTSVGYGASFGGLAALLAMLNSCASGVSVVNIDNGFGAGYLAGMINKL